MRRKHIRGSRKSAVRHRIPDNRVFQTTPQYITAFSGVNHLKPSEFTIGGKVIVA